MAPKVTVLEMLLFLVSRRELQQGDMNKNLKITDQKDTCWIFLLADSSTKWICFLHLVYSKLLHKQFFHCSKLSTLVLIKAFHASNLELQKKLKKLGSRPFTKAKLITHLFHWIIVDINDLVQVTSNNLSKKKRKRNNVTILVR